MMPFGDNEWENEGSRSRHGEIRNRTVAPAAETFPSLGMFDDLDAETTARSTATPSLHEPTEPPALEDLIVLVPPPGVSSTSETTLAGGQKILERDVFELGPDASLVGPALVATGRRWRRSIAEAIPVLPLVAALLAGVTLTVSALAIMTRPDPVAPARIAAASVPARPAAVSPATVSPVTVAIGATAAPAAAAPAMVSPAPPAPMAEAAASAPAEAKAPAVYQADAPANGPAIAFLPPPDASAAGSSSRAHASKTAPARQRRGGAKHAARSSNKQRAASRWVDPFAPKPVQTKAAKTLTKDAAPGRWVDPFAN